MEVGSWCSSGLGVEDRVVAAGDSIRFNSTTASYKAWALAPSFHIHSTFVSMRRMVARKMKPTGETYDFVG